MFKTTSLDWQFKTNIKRIEVAKMKNVEKKLGLPKVPYGSMKDHSKRKCRAKLLNIKLATEQNLQSRNEEDNL